MNAWFYWAAFQFTEEGAPAPGAQATPSTPPSTVDSWLGYLTGPFAALVFCLVLLALIIRYKWLVPGYVHEADERRIASLEASGDKMTQALLEGAENMAGLRERLAAADAKLEAAAGRIGDLAAQIQTLREELARRERGVD